MAPDLFQQGILDGVAVAEAVEHYVSLQGQIKELQAQFDEVKQRLVDFCQAEGLNRAYGREHAITYKLVEKTGFSEDEVRALLEPEGLWHRVLSLDQSRLRQLISDEAAAKDIRDKLAALKRVVSSYPQLWARRIMEEE